MSSAGRTVLRSLIAPLAAVVVTLALLGALLAGVAMPWNPPGAGALAITIDSDHGEGVEPALLDEVKKLLASDGQEGDVFGRTVSVSGKTAVVGAFAEKSQAYEAGAAYVFERNEGGGNGWGEVKKLTASDEIRDYFGYSVSVSGDTIVVGAYGEDDSAGAAYIFERNEGGADNWGEVKMLVASDAHSRDRFGRGVAIEGDTIVVGAYFKRVGVPDEGPITGAAYVFERNAGGAENWGEVKKLLASDGEHFDFFGLNVAVSGDTIVAGANGEDDGGLRAGAAYVFGRNEGGADNWGEVKKLVASDAQAEVGFGASVAAGGDIVVAGAPSGNCCTDNAGAAYVFERNEGGADNWGEVKKLIASDGQAGDSFGSGVAISGDTVVAGACCEDAGGSNAGAAYIFGRNEGGADNWGEAKKLVASDAESEDFFGFSVALSGGTAVVGAVKNSGPAEVGAAYVFEEPRSVGGVVELAVGSGDAPAERQTGGAPVRAMAAIAFALAAAGIAGASWRRYRRWAG